MEKETTELLNELKSNKNLETYFSDNEDEFLNYTLVEYFDRLLKKYNLIKSDVIKKSNLPSSYTYQTFSGTKKTNRDRIIAIAFGFGLDLIETQRLLRIAGFSELYARNKRDCFIIQAIQNKSSVVVLNTILDENNLDILDGTANAH